MQPLPEIDNQFLQATLMDLLNIASPTGFSHNAINFSIKKLEQFEGLSITKTNKGGLTVAWQGESGDSPRALTAHADTLGAMVKEIKSNGRLKLTKIGGFAWNTVEGEGCSIHTYSDEIIRGSLLLTTPSSHSAGEKVNKTVRTDDTMEIRIDAKTSSIAETKALGIEIGDFVSFDPRVEITNGFIRSRHLDDKACIATLFAAIKALQDANLKPARTTYFHISNYEEVGHGAAAGFPDEITELVTLDMAVIGEGQTSDEFNATICVKDSAGPYHHGLSKKLRNLADQYDIDYKVDVYPFYGSDGEAYWRAGGDVAVALIGPGIDASHNYERTHQDSLVATTKWIMAYLLNS
jgi:putative aminopeptidase FrvX